MGNGGGSYTVRKPERDRKKYDIANYLEPNEIQVLRKKNPSIRLTSPKNGRR